MGLHWDDMPEDDRDEQGDRRLHEARDERRVARFTWELGVSVARAQADGWQQAEPWCPEPQS